MTDIKSLAKRYNFSDFTEKHNITLIKLAKKKNIEIALIDQDIEITLKRLSQELTWKEKFKFIIDLIKAAIFRKKELDFDLTKVPKKKVIKRRR